MARTTLLPTRDLCQQCGVKFSPQETEARKQRCERCQQGNAFRRANPDRYEPIIQSTQVAAWPPPSDKSYEAAQPLDESTLAQWGDDAFEFPELSHRVRSYRRWSIR